MNIKNITQALDILFDYTHYGLNFMTHLQFWVITMQKKRDFRHFFHQIKSLKKSSIYCCDLGRKTSIKMPDYKGFKQDLPEQTAKHPRNIFWVKTPCQQLPQKEKFSNNWMCLHLQNHQIRKEAEFCCCQLGMGKSMLRVRASGIRTWLIDWLIDWSIDWFMVGLIDWLID